jgi:predicted MPP superfamily phosphohydrolase
MKIKFCYLIVLSVLFFACKKREKPVPVPDPNPIDTTAVKVNSLVKPLVTTSTEKFLVLSDVHVDVNLPVTYFGANSVSVTCKALWKKTKAKLESVAKAEQPTFMLYLGDLPGYNDSTRRTNTHAMLENLRDLNVGIPILYLPGNNDSLEGDYHSFSNSNAQTVLTKDKDTINPWPVINSKASGIKVGNLDFSKAFGYYSVDLTDSGNTLKVIALNTVIFCNKSKYHQYVSDDKVSQQTATQEQMTWLETTLSKLTKNDRVLLIMHIPIGLDGYSGDAMWNPVLTFTDASGKTQGLHNGFLDLLSKHKANIVGLLNGHTHLDGLRRIYNGKVAKASDMISYSISTPGIAVNHQNNPAFKTFTYDTKSFDLLDFETYYASPTAHYPKTKKGKYNSEFEYLKNSSYTFKDEYCIKDKTETMFTSLSKQTNAQILAHIDSTLGAKSNKDVKLQKKASINVFKN